MEQTSNFSNSEFQQTIDKAFDKLESSLVQKLSHKNNISQYKADIASLIKEKNTLSQQLADQANECNKWKEACHEVITRLNYTIENVKAILQKEQVSE
ncbi:DUF4164 domain-containing protein [Ehrlichia canis]|uniref:Uncharacterized protein n=1 Tax=Ehrlichia canis (strain Jake) TaxID=269484 RepID=A0ACA6AW33_EHRCJ|nr:DUF4164 domain-containing protein [Ehrlichia canis]AAZ68654.1 hypothetical protein Ecaj_0620 [Ehrlichia canis str. Jake]AUO54615.1 DUF4164 domain-containing protein [Ehrlichia canis]UKC53818.1 DUF4164 domain-containing protein [Ehrlichia canis]UKC54754.1 DUF4164 domain-containing protein [Ehrlichia canis]UKC55690.1 DUF4164 domain-containing protein [Ehrlichia canis]